MAAPLTRSAANQKWTISATSGGYYRLTPTHATNMALDVNGVSTADGANVQIWTYGGGNNQQWTFQSP
jgi:endoglucanase